MVEGAPDYQDDGPLTENMTKFLEALKDCLGRSHTGVIDQEQLAEVMKLLLEFPLAKADWEPFAFFDKTSYARNLIAECSGQYQIVLLCWNPGQQRYESMSVVCITN